MLSSSYDFDPHGFTRMAKYFVPAGVEVVTLFDDGTERRETLPVDVIFTRGFRISPKSWFLQRDLDVAQAAKVQVADITVLKTASACEVPTCVRCGGSGRFVADTGKDYGHCYTCWGSGRATSQRVAESELAAQQAKLRAAARLTSGSQRLDPAATAAMIDAANAEANGDRVDY